MTGRAGARGENYVAHRFRDALEDAAVAFQAKGKVQPVPDDKHREVADDVAERQAASLRGGVTLQRSLSELETARRSKAGRQTVSEMEAGIASLQARTAAVRP